jgi:predicted lipid-binding transport protein (Tim44 family)
VSVQALAPTIVLALVCIFLGSIAVVFLRLFIQSASADTPRVETHWGGLGGGLGGWTISASFVYLAVALVAMVLLTATATVWPKVIPPSMPQTASEKPANSNPGAAGKSDAVAAPPASSATKDGAK